MNKTIVMFDMDGTLTESRKKFDEDELFEKLKDLLEITEVGIITGSDYDYLIDQMGDVLSKFTNKQKIHLMPCNGTKYYKFCDEKKDFLLSHNACMKKQLGKEKYREIIGELIISQVDMYNNGVPLTGHFINCRGSLINWCPIGRNATHQDREEFIKMDKEKKIRERTIEELRSIFEIKNVLNKITIKLGGDTSFDIYPKGWDKTYGLSHFDGWDVWFVGDRCYPNGNDYEIYSACTGRSFITSGPKDTCKIIKKIIQEIRSQRE